MAPGSLRWGRRSFPTCAKKVAFMAEDRELWPDIRQVEAMVRSGELLALMEELVPDFQ